MKNNIKRLLASLALGISSVSPVFAGMGDDPIITKLMLDKFEVGNANGKNPLAWEGGFWIGKDLNKLYFKTEGERVGGETEGTESKLLLSHAVDPFWDLQGGISYDTTPDANRTYATIGFQGEAPFYIETDASLSFGKNSQAKLNASFENEMMLTQRWVLIPEIGFNAYAKDDTKMGIGSGLSDISASLRLGYEIKREFMPYIGINWGKKFGKTADLTTASGEDISETMFVVGISAWY
jgi:copper resistance protein B